MKIQRFIFIRHWSPVWQILLLLAEIMGGALIWVWVLGLVSPFTLQDFLLGRVIAGVWANLALVGFYLWLGSVICLFGVHRQESFAGWRFNWRVYLALGFGLVLGFLLLIFFRLCAGAGFAVLWQTPVWVYLFNLVGALLLAGLEELLFRLRIQNFNHIQVIFCMLRM